MKNLCNVKCVMCNVIFIFFALHITPYTLHRSFAQDKPTSGDLIVKTWEAHGKKDIEKTFEYSGQLIDLYKDEADRQQASLKVLPKSKPEVEAVAALNDVATAYFIQGESYRDQGKKEEAIAAFKIVVDKYCCAQAWDPRGWFWQVAKAAQESIAKLDSVESKELKDCKCAAGNDEKTSKCKAGSLAPTKIVLYDPGKEDFVDYSKYGEFKNIGTKDYQYVIKDQEGLSLAVGEGIYPNTTSIRWDPAWKKAQKDKDPECTHWDFVNSLDLEAAFLIWATASEPAGVKLFYEGLILEKAGLLKHALKCYYAVLVHFPKAYGWTYWHTPWYVGQAAASKINFILRRNPGLGYCFVDADINIINGYDNDIANDEFIVNPGRFIKTDIFQRLKKADAAKNKKYLSIKKRSGKGKVYVQQYETGDWELMVNGKPYTIKGITYAPTKVGQSPDNGTLGNWMEEDFNKNGKQDGPYDAFVDTNGNGAQDKDEPAVGDFSLMKDMGVNTIRLYHHPLKINKELLRDMYNKYGIRVIIGDFFGKYAIGSGAPWNPGTDYNNEEHKKNMLESVTDMVREFKDEPYVLFWLLGNENVYGIASNADKEPDAFFKFANEVSRKIKEIDPDHPVAVCSGDVLFLDKFGKNSSDIDIFGTNAYRGDYGFGFIWRQVQEQADKPIFITEFGCPAYALNRDQNDAEQQQAEYHRGCWEDIKYNAAFSQGMGNSIGGVAFEWLDEWWKAYEPSVHDTKGLFTGPFPDGFMHEEWLGICGQGAGKLSPFLRQLRKSYFVYKKMWR